MYPYTLTRVRFHPGALFATFVAQRCILLCKAIEHQEGKGYSGMGKAQGSRPRGNRIDVWTDAQELAEINARCKALKLSRSEYLRSLGLGYQPKGQFDQETIRELVKLHADQGRLGGLLKLWLSEKTGEGAPAKDVRAVLQQIESLQMQIARLVMKETVRR